MYECYRQQFIYGHDVLHIMYELSQSCLQNKSTAIPLNIYVLQQCNIYKYLIKIILHFFEIGTSRNSWTWLVFALLLRVNEKINMFVH